MAGKKSIMVLPVDMMHTAQERGKGSCDEKAHTLRGITL